jgi:hypothetical protein
VKREWNILFGNDAVGNSEQVKLLSNSLFYGFIFQFYYDLRALIDNAEVYSVFGCREKEEGVIFG